MNLQPWQPRRKTLNTIGDAINDLIANFDEALDAFDDAVARDETFGGPSLYFHYQCIAEFWDVPVSQKLQSDRFFELVYATLTSWGMHRMGNTKTKLRDFEEIKAACTAQKDRIVDLEHTTIWEITEDPRRLEVLSQLVDSLRISLSSAHLVANTKTLHHLLPKLVPPVDRQYTLVNLGLNTTLPSNHTAGSIFAVLFPQLARAALAVRDEIRRRDSINHGRTWHTSPTKILDNAVIGMSLLNRRE